MTTIAFDGYTLAYDTRMTQEDFPTAELCLPKARLIHGHYICCAGNLEASQDLYDEISNCASFELWLAQKPDTKFSDLDVMVIRACDGQVYTHSPKTFIPIKNKLWSVGSGRKYALGAMAEGATAVKAVHIASWFDIHTNSNVCQISVFNKHQ